MFWLRFQPHRNECRANHHKSITEYDFCTSFTVILKHIHHGIESPRNRKNDSYIKKEIMKDLNQHEECNKIERRPANRACKEGCIGISRNSKTDCNNQHISNNCTKSKFIIPDIQLFSKDLG